MGNEGAAALADALTINSTLREMDLDWSGITDVGFETLATALESNWTVTSLKLKDSKSALQAWLGGFSHIAGSKGRQRGPSCSVIVGVFAVLRPLRALVSYDQPR